MLVGDDHNLSEIPWKKHHIEEWARGRDAMVRVPDVVHVKAPAILKKACSSGFNIWCLKFTYCNCSMFSWLYIYILFMLQYIYIYIWYMIYIYIWHIYIYIHYIYIYIIYIYTLYIYIYTHPHVIDKKQTCWVGYPMKIDQSWISHVCFFDIPMMCVNSNLDWLGYYPS